MKIQKISMTVGMVALCLIGAIHAWAKPSVLVVRSKNSTTNITTSTWVAIGTLTAKVTAVDINNNSTSGTLQLGMGAPGSEVALIDIPPSTSKVVPLSLPNNARLVLKAVDATVSAGDINLNFFGVGQLGD